MGIDKVYLVQEDVAFMIGVAKTLYLEANPQRPQKRSPRKILKNAKTRRGEKTHGGEGLGATVWRV